MVIHGFEIILPKRPVLMKAPDGMSANIRKPSNIKDIDHQIHKDMYSETCCIRAYTQRVSVISVKSMYYVQ